MKHIIEIEFDDKEVLENFNLQPLEYEEKVINTVNQLNNQLKNEKDESN